MHASMSDLLDLTRMEEGAVQVRYEWCPADDLVEEARAALGARLGRPLRVEVPADAIVWCDPRLLRQALVNLVDNAVHHAPPDGRIDVRVELARGAWRWSSPTTARGCAGQERERVQEVRPRARRAADGHRARAWPSAPRWRACTAARSTARNDGGARFTLTLPQPAADRRRGGPA